VSKRRPALAAALKSAALALDRRGQLDRFRRKWMPYRPPNVHCPGDRGQHDEPEPAGFDQAGGAYSLMASGVLVAIFIALIEKAKGDRANEGEDMDLGLKWTRTSKLASPKWPSPPLASKNACQV